MCLNCDISDKEQAIAKASGFKIKNKFSKVGFPWDISGNWNGIISVLMYIYWNNMQCKNMSLDCSQELKITSAIMWLLSCS